MTMIDTTAPKIGLLSGWQRTNPLLCDRIQSPCEAPAASQPVRSGDRGFGLRLKGMPKQATDLRGHRQPAEQQEQATYAPIEI